MDSAVARSSRWLRWPLYFVVAAVMLGAIGVASHNALADWDRDPRTRMAGVTTGPLALDEELISIRLRQLDSAADADSPAMHYDVRVAVEVDGRIADWNIVEIAGGGSVSVASTVVASSRAGELVFAVGPLQHDGVAPLHARAIVQIDGSPYAIIHREPVSKLIRIRAREKLSIEFHHAGLGVRGAVDLRHLV